MKSSCLPFVFPSHVTFPFFFLLSFPLLLPNIVLVPQYIIYIFIHSFNIFITVTYEVFLIGIFLDLVSNTIGFFFSLYLWNSWVRSFSSNFLLFLFMWESLSCTLCCNQRTAESPLFVSLLSLPVYAYTSENLCSWNFQW